jgi:hypothetical protein
MPLARIVLEMSSKYILEHVALIENDFSADSRNKDGVRTVTYDARRSIVVHLAIDHIVQIEVVNDSKHEEERSIVTLTNGNRFITKRSASDLCAAIEEAAGNK